MEKADRATLDERQWNAPVLQYMGAYVSTNNEIEVAKDSASIRFFTKKF